MAAKKAKTTRKYRQAKTAAKAAAKEAFPGKKQASKRDPKLKISAEDRIVAKEVSESAKADLGKNAYLKKSDYEATQKAAREKFRSAMREEFGEYGGKKAEPAEAEVAKKETKPSVKKKAVKKAAATKAAPSKPSAPAPAKAATAPKVSKSAANKAAWAKMTPEERRNWKTTKPGAFLDKGDKEIEQLKKNNPKKFAANEKAFRARVAASKAVAEAPAVMPKQKTATTPRNIDTKPIDVKAPANRPTDASLRAKENAYLKETKARVDAKKPAAPKTTKPKASAPKPAAKAAAVAKKGSRTVRASKFIAKKFPLAMVAGEVISAGKGSTFKDLNEINRLKAKLGDKPMSAKEGAATQASNLANLASMGLVGKTRRQRMDELNAKIKKKEAATAKANKGLRYGKGGESLVPGTDAYKKGSKTRPTGAGSASKPNVGAGGSTTKYTVKKGDTLSGIAKNSGLSLSEVRKLNPELMSNPKYKKGSMIWSGTKVNVKKK